MITLPNGKICMNEQEAIQWLLDNYPIPFQCSANYAPETEIGLGTIVNPTPAKVKVGSIIFFADSKVSTVIAVNANSFICSDQYNDLVDDVVYVSNVQLNASGHLIVTLSNDTNIDAGLIKQVSSFSINSSQHLIASYNDGTTTDLGAIFSGNVSISGNLSVTGKITGITQLENIEDVSGNKRFVEGNGSPVTLAGFTSAYCRWSLSGSHLMAVLAGNFVSGASIPDNLTLASFSLPQWVADKIYPVFAGTVIEVRNVELWADDYSKEAQDMVCLITIYGQSVNISKVDGIAATTKARAFRIQIDLLIDNN